MQVCIANLSYAYDAGLLRKPKFMLTMPVCCANLSNAYDAGLLRKPLGG